MLIATKFTKPASVLKKIRFVESVMMTPFFFIGFFFAFPNSEVSSKHLLAFFFFYIHVQSIYLLNSYFGKNYDKLNKRFSDKIIENNTVANLFLLSSVLLFLLSLFIAIQYNTEVTILIAVNFLLWILYASPMVNLKKHHIYGSLIHLFSGILNFHIGFLILAPLSVSSFLLSIYFALLFTSGHLHHVIIDYEADKLSDFKTLPVKIGIDKTYYISIFLVLISSAYSVVLFYLNYLPVSILTTISLCSLIHLGLFYHFKKSIHQFSNRVKYRSLYRIVHAINIILIIIINVDGRLL